LGQLKGFSGSVNSQAFSQLSLDTIGDSVDIGVSGGGCSSSSVGDIVVDNDIDKINAINNHINDINDSNDIINNIEKGIRSDIKNRSRVQLQDEFKQTRKEIEREIEKEIQKELENKLDVGVGLPLVPEANFGILPPLPPSTVLSHLENKDRKREIVTEKEKEKMREIGREKEREREEARARERDKEREREIEEELEEENEKLKNLRRPDVLGQEFFQGADGDHCLFSLKVSYLFGVIVLVGVSIGNSARKA
jgi:VIT1/CCC1 family predicted Fe2+/Mn2+ transporter